MAGENRKQGKPHTGVHSFEDGVSRSVYTHEADGTIRRVGALKARKGPQNPNAQQTAYMKKKGLRKEGESELPPLEK